MQASSTNSKSSVKPIPIPGPYQHSAIYGTTQHSAIFSGASTISVDARSFSSVSHGLTVDARFYSTDIVWSNNPMTYSSSFIRCSFLFLGLLSPPWLNLWENVLCYDVIWSNNPAPFFLKRRQDIFFRLPISFR